MLLHFLIRYVLYRLHYLIRYVLYRLHSLISSIHATSDQKLQEDGACIGKHIFFLFIDFQVRIKDLELIILASGFLMRKDRLIVKFGK